jgi:hypothetical protein
MNIKNFLVGGVAGALMLGAMVIPAFAAKPANTVLVNNWTVYNRSDSFAKLWENYKATDLSNGGVGFAFNNVSTTWYTAYLKAHYNGDLTGTTITANVSVTDSSSPTFVSRGGGTPTVGLVIKSAEGNWGVNDYWWPTNRVTLSTLGTDFDIIASTSELDRTSWINICGKSANDVIPYTGESCIPGMMYPAESPYDGFTSALKNIKEVGLSFGGSGYARGVALDGGTASFQLNSFKVED